MSILGVKEIIVNRITLEKLIRDTDSLTFLNALKSLISELKEEVTTIEETQEYQAHAIERARKIMRRIDNQYRGIIKSTARMYNPAQIQVHTELAELEEDE